MPDIKCTVSSCFFWRNDICGAPAIEVAPSRGGGSPSSDAGEIGTVHGARVAHSEQTQCVTFRQRSGQQAPRPEPRQPSPAGGRKT